MLRRLRWLILPALGFFFIMNGSAAVAADQTPMTAELRHVELEWARITYQVKNSDEQDKEMRTLAAEAAQIVARYPGRAEPLIWDGIVASLRGEICRNLQRPRVRQGCPRDVRKGGAH